MTWIGRAATGLLGVLDDVGVDALDEGVTEALVHRRRPPGDVLAGRPDAAAGTTHRPGELEEPFGRIGPAVEDDVLDPLPKLRLDVVIDRELAGVDDAHVHPGRDRVVKEDRVDRLANGVVATEREADVGHAAAHEGSRQLGLDPAGRIDVGRGVRGVRLDAGGDGEDVRVEDDVLRLIARLGDKQVVGTAGDRDLAFDRVGLALLVEGHHDDGGAVAADEPRLAEELGLAFLHADRVHDAAALQVAGRPR